jgi:6-bladed beta-propeller
MNKFKRELVMAVAAAVILNPGLVSAATTSVQRDSTRIIPLPELEHPSQICAEGGRIYILDARDIIVYDLKDGRLLMRIGKRGQGPGEFTLGPGRLTVFSDRLVIEDFHKIKFFTLDGEYSSEIREPSFVGPYPFLPVGKNFVGFPMERRDDGSLSPAAGCIYDKDLKPKKRFFGEFPMGPPPPPPPGSPPPATKTDTLLIRDYTDYVVFGGKIYVADSRKGLSIAVFDENGDVVSEIRHTAEKVKVPKSFLDAVIKERKASKYWDSIYAHQNPVVPDYFPDFVGFKIDGGRIYVVTPAQKGGLYEVIVMDLMGKILEKSFRFPIKPNFGNLEFFGLNYDVENDAFIWIDYNDAKEIYELHIR